MEIFKDKNGRIIKKGDVLRYKRVSTGFIERCIDRVIGEHLTRVEAGPYGFEFLGSDHFESKNYEVETDPSRYEEERWMNSL